MPRFDRYKMIRTNRFFALTLLLVSLASLATAKPPHLIRDHLLNDSDKSITSVNSVESFHAEALDDLVTTGIWKVAYNSEGNDGESLVFMAVKDGEVLRIHRFDQPRTRENFLKLLPDDFRVTSDEDAKRLVAATLALYFGFPFSEPEKTVDELRVEKRNGEYFFVDGERFGDATGYHITTDDEGRVTGYEYSWELPVAPPEN
ncbi:MULTISPECIES: hypothetical protein [unclassified Wenzhouxiangella]|uniref:hypothetical protein n=1 Tax=unclassified Wenzhouxiangella TaxID=2613841 RepID=UPI0011C06A02|nr:MULTISPECIES: hypothetical protein [unclassified Wenzhouxiangella]